MKIYKEIDLGRGELTKVGFESDEPGRIEWDGSLYELQENLLIQKYLDQNYDLLVQEFKDKVNAD